MRRANIAERRIPPITLMLMLLQKVDSEAKASKRIGDAEGSPLTVPIEDSNGSVISFSTSSGVEF